MTDLSAIADAPIETFISILSMSSDEIENIYCDPTQPRALTLLIELLRSKNQTVVLNTLKWITDQMERQKSSLPISIERQISQYGELGYSEAEIIALHPDCASAIKQGWKAKKGLYIEYMKGVALGKYKIDAQLLEKASQGNLKAIEMINIRKMLK